MTTSVYFVSNFKIDQKCSGYEYLWYAQHIPAISPQWKYRSVKIWLKKKDREKHADGRREKKHAKEAEWCEHASSCEEAENAFRLQRLICCLCLLLHI